MGTTMAFYNIQNRGVTPEKLQKKLGAVPEAPSINAKDLFRALIPPDMLEQFLELSSFDGLEHQTVIAFKESARWLPFFCENFCESYVASSKDTMRLSKIFDAPVIAFSIFDSDVLFVSYSDNEKGLPFDYAKPNYDEFEDFDTEQYSTDFPDFLLHLCSESDHQKLRDIWESTGYVFADDRMHDICALIQAETIYDSRETIPEGYQVISGHEA